MSTLWWYLESEEADAVIFWSWNERLAFVFLQSQILKNLMSKMVISVDEMSERPLLNNNNTKNEADSHSSEVVIKGNPFSNQISQPVVY